MTHEKLSCLLDDQAVADLASQTDELIGDVNLQYRMRRYRMIGEAMRHELPAAIDTDFHHRVRAKIRDQENRSSPQRSQPRSLINRLAQNWLKPVGGLAIAATVAVVTVSLWQPTAIQPEPQIDSLASAQQQKIEDLVSRKVIETPVLASSQLPALGTRWKISNEIPGLQQKLNGYLVNHTEYSNSMQGLIPQARVAGYDAQE